MFTEETESMAGRTRQLKTSGNLMIENILNTWHEFDRPREMIDEIIDTIIDEMMDGFEVIIPIELPEGVDSVKEDIPFKIYMLEGDDGNDWIGCFTNKDEFKRGENVRSTSVLFKDLINKALGRDSISGIVINPFGNMISIPREMLKHMLDECEPPTQDMIDLMNGSEAYQNGDYETAVELYEKAARAGNVTALSNLGYCHYYGCSVPVDKEKARQCWEKAAVLDDICAIYKLGDMYRNGDLPEDPVYFRALYRKAFELAVKEGDLWNYPDAYLRVLKYCSDELDRKTLFDIASDCVDGLKARIEKGDNYSEGLLKEAEALKLKYTVKEGE